MNMPTSSKLRGQGGFTLIELIVVIVILGILAATAMPKFADLGGDARYAALKGAKGAVDAVVQMARARALISGNDSADVKMEGVDVNMQYGYPKANITLTNAAGMAAAEWSIDTSDTTKLTIKPLGTTKTGCHLVYTPPAGAGGTPTLILTGSATAC